MHVGNPLTLHWPQDKHSASKPLQGKVACGGTPPFLLVLCLTIIGGLELLASTYVYTPDADLVSLVVVGVHHPFPIKWLKGHMLFQMCMVEPR